MKIPKALIVSIIVFAISGLAFTAGFLRERVVTEIEEIKGTITNDEILVEKIDSKVSDILLFDFITTNDARNEINNFKELATEHDILYENLTTEEKLIYKGRLQASINRYENLIQYSYLGQLVNHFDNLSLETDFPFATFDPDGYNYSITSDEFFDLDASIGLYTIETKAEFLNPKINMTFWDPILNLRYEEYTIPDEQANWVVLYRSRQSQIQQSVINNSQILADLESEVSYYSYGVTAITVATILASTMAVQLNEKEREKEFSHIKSKIYENESMIITKSKIWPMILVFVAFILAIIGLILPILLF